jgi:predicted permease
MLTVFLKVASIFCMVAIGFFLNKRGILPKESNPYLVNLLLMVTSPCLIVSSMASQTLTAQTIRKAAEVLVGSAIFFIATALVAFLVVKALRYEPASDRGVMMVIITAINSGFMGFPVTKAIFGDELFFLMVIENIILNFYLYFLAVIQMNYGQQKHSSLKDVIKPLCNMCTLALIAGLVILIGRIQLPDVLYDFFDTIAGATVPLSMIVVGIQLAESNLRKMIQNHKLIIVSLCNVVLIPVLTFLAVNWLPLTNESKLTLIFAASFPCAVVSVAVAAKEGRNSALMAEGVAMTTLFSLVTLPISAMFLMHMYC